MINKKGSAVDNIYVLVSFVVFAIFMLGLLIFWNQAKAIPDFWDKSTIGESIKNNAQGAFNNWDLLILFGYFALHIGVILTAYFFREHPITLIITFLLILIMPLVAAPMSNAFESIIDNDVFITAKSEIPITVHIMSKLPFYELMWSILTMVALYGFKNN